MIDQFGNYVPEWQDLGVDQPAPDMGPFAQALKNRFASKQPVLGHPETEHDATNPAMPLHIDTFSKGIGSHEVSPMKNGFGGGGMKSL